MVCCEHFHNKLALGFYFCATRADCVHPDEVELAVWRSGDAEGKLGEEDADWGRDGSFSGSAEAGSYMCRRKRKVHVHVCIE